MNSKLLIGIVALAIGISGAALADSIHGKIRVADKDHHTITLTNGITFHYGDSVVDADFAPGAYVAIEYKTQKGLPEAKTVRVTAKAKN